MLSRNGADTLPATARYLYNKGCEATENKRWKTANSFFEAAIAALDALTLDQRSAADYQLMLESVQKIIFISLQQNKLPEVIHYFQRATSLLESFARDNFSSDRVLIEDFPHLTLVINLAVAIIQNAQHYPHSKSMLNSIYESVSQLHHIASQILQTPKNCKTVDEISLMRGIVQQMIAYKNKKDILAERRSTFFSREPKKHKGEKASHSYQLRSKL